MLSKEENELLTRTDPGTPCGDLLRRYWQPVALSEELGTYPIPLRIMGEDLVLFRDDQGRIGLLDIHCSHRAADLSYGRAEDGGLRCIYHGWLYDVNGRCLETPAEPEGSNLRLTIRHPAYPCQERGGVIFAYMGPGEPPLLPAYAVLAAPPERRVMTKYYHECNYLQGLEGNEDSTHVRFLHRFLNTESGARFLQAHPSENNTEFRTPERGKFYGPTEIEETDFGVWSNGRPGFLLPSLALTGGGPQPYGDGYMLYWRVPIDDTHHWLYIMAFKESGPILQEKRHGWTDALVGADYRPYRNLSNRYLQDREEQRTATFTGMGPVFPPHDACVNEGAGPIQDRTREHLGSADSVIPACRKLMLRCIRMVQEGHDPAGVIRDAEVNRADPLWLRVNAPPPPEAAAARAADFWVESVRG
ncbi:MAG TPA: Rieske 2Fe-2S domain-containing protein [Chloroflexota bacterium]|nr:Rieske 2Fe-2S domain-containing protein [Chloroflexota bacterium]